MAAPRLESPTPETLLRRIRFALAGFIVALILSGLTAFPLLKELDLIAQIRGLDAIAPNETGGGFDAWILTVRNGLRESYAKFPWLAYGTDWLAFAHVVIAIFFIGPFIDPTRNIWIVHAGMIACGLVVPLALVCGAIRQIPMGWRLIDCSFGVFGVLPLLYVFKLTKALEKRGDKGWDVRGAFQKGKLECGARIGNGS